MKLIERVLSALAWLQIAASLAVVGLALGLLLWLAIRGIWGVGIGVAVALLGCGAGAVFAEKERRGKGTIVFLSRLIAHPELKNNEKKG